MYFLSFLSMLGWIISLSKKNNKYIAVYPIFIVTSIPIILYISSFLQILWFVSKFLFFTGIFLLVINCILVLFKNKFSTIKIYSALKSVNPAIIFFICFSIIWFFYSKNIIPNINDEFFWGKYAKIIFYNNSLNNLTGYQINYPPGIPLLHYFFLQFKYSEPALFFAQGILFIAGLSPIFSIVSPKKKFLKLIGTFLFVSIVIAYFGSPGIGILTILNDHIIGSILGSILIISFFILKKPKEKLFFLVPLVSFLPLIKEPALIISLISIFLLLIDHFVKNNKSKAILLLLVIFPILITISWRFFLQNKKITSNYTVNSILNTNKKEITINPTPSINTTHINPTPISATPIKINKKEIIEKRIIFAVFSWPISNDSLSNIPSIISIFKKIPVINILINQIVKINNFRISIFGWFAIITFFIFVNFYRVKNYNTKKILIIIAGILISFIFYLFLLLLFYKYAFSEYEGLKLASLERYVGTLFFGLSLFLIAIITNQNHSVSIKINKISFLCLLVLLIIQTPPLWRIFSFPNNRINTILNIKKEMEPFVKKIEKKTSKNANIYYVFNNNDSLKYLYFKYEIFPKKVNPSTIYFGSNAIPDKPYTEIISIEQFEKKIINDKFDYLLLDKIDGFCNKYQKLFTSVDDCNNYFLFRTEIKNGHLKFLLLKD